MVPPYCIYAAHNYNPSFKPDKPKYTATHDLTYDYAFDKSDIATALWGECKFIASAIDIDIELSNWYDVFNMLDIQDNKNKLTIRDIIKLSLVVQTITCIYNTYKKTN